MVEAEVREWVCWILLVRLMFVLFLGLLLMWYWCVQATLCVFSWRVRISLCNFKRCDILGLNTKSPRSSSATVSALRGIPASCAREFASEFSAGVFPFVPPKPGIFVMQTSSSVSFSFFWVDFFGIPLKVGFLYPSLVIWNDSIGYFPTGWQAKNVELTANVTQLMEAERNTRLTPCGEKKGNSYRLTICKVLGCSCILSKGNETRTYISYIQSRKNVCR